MIEVWDAITRYVQPLERFYRSNRTRNSFHCYVGQSKFPELSAICNEILRKIDEGVFGEIKGYDLGGVSVEDDGNRFEPSFSKFDVFEPGRE